MKTTISVILVFWGGIASIAQAEVPNGNFESWGNSKLTDWVPEFWETDNYFEYPTTIPDSNAFEGNLAMRVRPIQGFEGATPQTARTLFSITGIPTNLHFAVKTNIPDLDPYDEVSVQIEFLNEDAIIGSEIWTSTESIDEWQDVDLPIPPMMFPIEEARITVKAGYIGALGGGSIETWISVDNMSLDVTSGVDDVATSSILVYPNPCTDLISLNGIGNSTVPKSIRIFDASGRDCSSLIEVNKVATADRIDLDVRALANGLYQVVMQSGDLNKNLAVVTILKQ
ncbi:MAG: T9SS type A sorting domain-containing protein [Flavobacteriales bacterium]